MDAPDFRRLLGFEPETVTQLFGYGYRSAWRVHAGKNSFIVKSDERPELTANEVAAQRHAQRAGVPVAEIVAFEPAFPATVAMCWVEGVPLQEHSTPAARRDAGHWLRVLHGLPILRPRAEPLDEWLAEWFEFELNYMLQEAAITESDRAGALQVMQRMRPVLETTPLAWIHGDCQAAHFLVDNATDNVTAVLDWADAQHGAPEMDFGVLTMFEAESLSDILDGYEATIEVRQRLALPLYQAVRGAGSYRWLVEHQYGKQQFAIDLVKALAGTATP